MDNKSIDEKDVKIGIVGLGYVGLPAMLSFHNAGFKVIGIDTSEYKINMLKKMLSPLIDKTDQLIIPVESDNWKVTTDYSNSIALCDLIIIAVPTPVNNKKPNLEYIISAGNQIMSNIDKTRKTIVVLESTVYPGVTRSLLIDRCNDFGLTLGIEIDFAYCPERVSPGDKDRTVNNTARIVGCDSEDIGREIAYLYSKITKEECRYVGNPEIAEAAKLIENVQRDIDIAFVNEISKVLPKIGLDVEDVLDAAATKWNFHKHTPGIGVGGHCIPVDPYYYISMSTNIGENPIMSIGARNTNESMPKYTAREIMNKIKNSKNKVVLILGYSYKPELGDTRETPVYELTKELSPQIHQIY